MEAAKRGYLAYTNCTASVTEVVPFLVHSTLGTNPHSWGIPTTEALGYPVVIDWATSVIAMGRVQQLKREGKPLPPVPRWMPMAMKPPIPTPCMPSSPSGHTRDMGSPCSMK